MNRYLIAVALLSASTPDLVKAQEGTERLAPQDDNRSRSVDNDFTTGFAGSGIVVKGSAEKSDASFTLSRSENDPTGSMITDRRYSFKFTVPLDEKAGKANFITDGGLSKVYSAEFALNLLSAPNSVPTLSGAEIAAILDAAKKECEKDPSPTKPSTCPDNARGLRHWLTPEQREQLDGPPITKPVTVFTLTGGIGRKSFKWRDINSLGQEESMRTPISVGAQIGWLFTGKPEQWSTGVLLAVGGEYKRTYLDADKQLACKLPAAGSLQECFNEPFDAPIRELTASVYVSARKRFLVGKTPLGLVLKPAYDFEKDVVAAKAQLFFVGDGKAALSGGVEATIQSRGKIPESKYVREMVGLFIGSTF